MVSLVSVREGNWWAVPTLLYFTPFAVCAQARIRHFPQPSRPAPGPSTSPGAAENSRSCVVQISVAKDLNVGMNILTLRDHRNVPMNSANERATTAMLSQVGLSMLSCSWSQK